MKARLIVNEIKQGLGSGMEGIGVGRSALSKGYKKMKEVFPGIEEFEIPLVEFEWFKASGTFFGSFESEEDVTISLSRDEMEDVSSISGIPLKDLVYIDPAHYSQKFAEDATIEGLLPLSQYLDRCDHVKVELNTNDPRRMLENNSVVRFTFVWWESARFGYLVIENGTYIFLVYERQNVSERRVNEIRTETEGSGLGAIGAGRVKMLFSDFLKSYDPSFKFRTTLDKDTFPGSTEDFSVNCANLAAEELGVSFNRIKRKDYDYITGPAKVELRKIIANPETTKRDVIIQHQDFKEEKEYSDDGTSVSVKAVPTGSYSNIKVTIVKNLDRGVVMLQYDLNEEDVMDDDYDVDLYDHDVYMIV